MSVQTFLEENKDYLVRLTSELCSFATENPPGKDFEPCVDFLQGYSESLGLKTEKIHVPEAYQRRYNSPETFGYPRFNLLARWNVGAEKTLHFNSHFDVVPVSDDWKTNPFQPVVKQGKLFGRGTCDMKGSLAASLFAVHALKACGLRPAWNIELSFTADEEIGGECGVGYLVKNKLVRPDAAVVCEGGSGQAVSFGHRGVLWADVLVRGVSAHGSNPQAGVNAFEKGIALAERMRALEKEFRRRKSRFPLDRPEFAYPTMTLGGVSGGGSKVNTVPDRFHFTIDRRLTPEERVNDVIKEFNTIIAEAKKKDKTLKAKMHVTRGFDAGITDKNAPICQIAKKAVQTVTGKNATLCIFGAFTDLHFFTGIAKCPTIGYGVEGEGLHGSREFLKIRSLVETARVYAEIMMNSTP